MSLTEQEREWLERRKNLCLHCSRYGRLCSKKAEAYGKCMALNLEVGDPDYRDAAEFEARVAALLATQRLSRWWEAPCHCGDFSCHHLKCPPTRDIMDHRLWCRMWCKLKTARLAVEEEMEKEQCEKK